MSQIKLLARHDRVILKPLQESEHTVDRIVVSDNGENKADQFEIVDIGPGFTNPHTGLFTPNQYMVGDQVFVKKAFVHLIQIDGEEYYITRDSEILCYINDKS